MQFQGFIQTVIDLAYYNFQLNKPEFQAQKESLAKALYKKNRSEYKAIYATHFCEEGFNANGLNPSPWIDFDFITRNNSIDDTSITKQYYRNYFEDQQLITISPSAFIDLEYYANNNHIALENALLHFLLEGVQKGINPSPYVDIRYYAALAKVANQDVLRHYLMTGMQSGLNVSPFIDTNYYLTTITSQANYASEVKDVKSDVISVFTCFVENEKKIQNNASPSPYFNVSYYQEHLSKTPSLIENNSSDTPFRHFLTVGEERGINPCPFFEPDFYEKQLDSATQEKIRLKVIFPLKHYIVIGSSQAFLPSPLFDIDFYLGNIAQSNPASSDNESKQPASQPTITKSQAFYHFLTVGLAAQINPCPYLNVNFYKTKNKDNLFVDPITDFFSDGYQKRDPSIYISLDYYSQTAHVSREHALLHFIYEGCSKGINPSIYFDINYYAATANVDKSIAFLHFIKVGMAAGRNANAFFNITYYKQQIANQKSNTLPTSDIDILEYFINSHKFVNPSPFYDADYLKPNDNQPLETYQAFLTEGPYTKLNACPLFDPTYSEILNDGINIREYLIKAISTNISPSVLFNVKYYKKQLSTTDVALLESGVITALEHYISTGESKGYNPASVVDINYYKSCLAEEKIIFNTAYTLLQDYVLYSEKRPSPSPFFDKTYYAQIANVSTSYATEHFLQEGCRRGINPSLYFDIKYYATIAKVKLEHCFEHYALVGEQQGDSPMLFFVTAYYAALANVDSSVAFRTFIENDRKLINYAPSPFFDEEFYLKSNSSVASEIEERHISAIHHFVAKGMAQGLNPCPFFDKEYYLSQLTAKEQEQINVGIYAPIQHFLVVGLKKGIIPTPFFDADFYIYNYALAFPTQPALTKKEAFANFINVGLTNNVNPLPLFDSAYYTLQSNNSQAQTIRDFLVYAVTSPSPYFDMEYYQRVTTKKFDSPLLAVRDFLVEGCKNGFDPSPYFTIDYYNAIAKHRSREAALRHYLEADPQTVLSPSPLFNLEFYTTYLTSLPTPAQPEAITRPGANDGLRDYLKYFIIVGDARDDSPSPYFEEDYYTDELSNNHIVKDQNQSNLKHFIEVGASLGLNPCPFFETTFYANSVNVDNNKTLQHYLLVGEKNSTNPCLLFDVAYYRNYLKSKATLQNDSEIQSELEAIRLGQKTFLQVYLEVGESRETSGEVPTPFFDLAFYQSMVGDIPDNIKSYLRHYLIVGEAENLSPTPFYEANFSVSAAEDKVEAASGVSHFRQYMTHDINIGVMPCLFIDFNYYLTQDSELKNSDIHLKPLALFKHIVSVGLKKNINTHPFFDTEFYKSNISLVEQQSMDNRIEVDAFLLNNSHSIFKNKKLVSIQTEATNTKIIHQAQQTNINALSNQSYLRHFLTGGESQGLNPSPFFDTYYYLKQPNISEVTFHITSAIRRFLLLDESRGITPTPFFEDNYYQSQLSDAQIALIKASKHSFLWNYLENATQQQLQPTPFYCQDFYKSQLSKKELILLENINWGIRHFLIYGEKAGYSPTPVFDNAYYQSQLNSSDIQTITSQGLSYIRYFLDYGNQEQYNPSPFFNVLFYQEQCSEDPDISFLNDTVATLRDFLLNGMQKEHDPAPFFYMKGYIKTNASMTEITEKKVNAVSTLMTKFVTKDDKQTYVPSKLFNKEYYLEQVTLNLPADLSEIETNIISPYKHFLVKGEKLGLSPILFFDDVYYQQQLVQHSDPQLSDVKNGKLTLIDHYFLYGKHRGYSPTPFFDADFYIMQLTPELRKKVNKKNALDNFMNHGQKLGYSPSVYFDVLYYALSNRIDQDEALQDYMLRGKTLDLSPSPFLDADDLSNGIDDFISKNNSSSSYAKHVKSWFEEIGKYHIPLITYILVTDQNLHLTFYDKNLFFSSVEIDNQSSVLNDEKLESKEVDSSSDKIKISIDIPNTYIQFPEYIEFYYSLKRLSQLEIIPASLNGQHIRYKLTKKNILAYNGKDSKLKNTMNRLFHINNLVQAKLDSATAIVSKTQSQNMQQQDQNKPGQVIQQPDLFYATLSNCFSHPNKTTVTSDQANAIYQTAKQNIAYLSMNYMNAYQLNSPYLKNRAFSSIVAKVNYQEMFGSLDYYNTNSDLSMHSAAAYFFDLIRILSAYVNDNDLFQRRPDLFEMQLDAFNTEHVVLYLEIVNYVLAKLYIANNTENINNTAKEEKTEAVNTDKLTPLQRYEAQINTAETSAFTALMTGRYLFSPPILLPQERSRAYLKKLGFSLSNFYNTKIWEKNTIDLQDFASCLEYLQLTIVEFDWLIAILNGTVSDNEFKYDTLIPDANLVSQVKSDLSYVFNAEAKPFFGITGIEKTDLDGLIPYEKDLVNQDKSYYSSQYINAGSFIDPISITIDYYKKSELINNLNGYRLHRLAIFRFLASKLNLNNRKLQSILQLLTIYNIQLGASVSADTLLKDIQIIARLQYLSNNSGVPIDIISSACQPMSTQDYLCIVNNLRSTDSLVNVKQDATHETLLLSFRSYLYSKISTANALSVTASSSLKSKSIKILQADTKKIQNIISNLGLNDSDLYILLNDSVINKLSNNITLVSWLKKISVLKKICGTSSLGLLSLYSLVCDNQIASGQTLLEYIYNGLYDISNEAMIEQVLALYNSANMLNKNNISIVNLYSALTLDSSQAYLNALNAKMQSIGTAIIAIVNDGKKQYSNSITVNQDNPPSSSTDLANTATINQNNISYCLIDLTNQVCQSLASIYQVDAQHIQTILSALNNSDNKQDQSICSFIFDDFETWFSNPNADDLSINSIDRENLMQFDQYLNLINILNLNIVNTVSAVNPANTSNALSSFNPVITTQALTSSNYSDVNVLVKLVKANSSQRFLTSFQSIKTICTLKSIQNTFKDNTNQFINSYKTALSQSPTDDFINLINLDEQVFDNLMQYIGINLNTSTKLSVEEKILQINHICNLVKILSKIKNNIGLLILISAAQDDVTAHITPLQASNDPSQDYASYYELYQTFSELIARIIQSNNPSGNDIFDLSRSIEQMKRNVFTYDLINGNYPSLCSFSNLNEISDYILLDVQTTGLLDTSPISQGIGSVQCYLQRCKMGIEKASASSIPQSWWDLLGDFRLWEANRKVLLYPETYVEPDLRIKQSDEFKTFSQNLLQSDMTPTALENAYRNYFNQLVNLNSMTVIDACFGHSKKHTGEKTEYHTLYLFGQSQAQSSQYYFRTVTFKIPPDTKSQLAISELDWGYWNNININMNQTFISPIFAYDRLFIFWVDSQVKSTVDPTNTPTYIVDYKVYYTYQNNNNTWQPSTIMLSASGIKINDFFNVQSSDSIVVNAYTSALVSITFQASSWKYQVALNKVTVRYESGKILVQYPCMSTIDQAYDTNLSSVSKLAKYQLDNNLVTTSFSSPTIGVFDSYNRALQPSLVSSPVPDDSYFKDDIFSSSTVPDYTPNVSDSITVKRVPKTSPYQFYIVNNPNSSYLVLYDHTKSAVSQTIPLTDTVAINNLNSSLFANNIKSLFDQETNGIDYYGSFGCYYWEAFFYSPMLIANYLNANSNFSSARDWYHYIFYPYQSTNNNGPVFKFPPFKKAILPINTALYNKMVNLTYADQLDPHAFAMLRPIVYMKSVVRKYVQNLVDWADSLYTDDTREEINAATNLYIMAKELLGDDPVSVGDFTRLQKAITIGQYYNQKTQDISVAFSNLTSKIFKYLEIQFLNNLDVDDSPILNVLYPYFDITENTDFTQLWTLITNRLFNIRHSNDINGNRQELPLFSPPLDVFALVKSAALGGIESVLSALTVQLPYHRFSRAITYAKEVVNDVIRLESAVLSSQQQSDEQNLILIQNNQQLAMLNLISAMKDQQVQQAQYALNQANDNIITIQNRIDYYNGLINTGLIPGEITGQALKMISQAFLVDANFSNLAASVAYAVPNESVGDAVALPDESTEYGGVNVGNMLTAEARESEMLSAASGAMAENVLTLATYSRRSQEWQQQLDQANNEMTTTKDQVQVCTTALAIANADKNSTLLSITQQQQIADYYHSRFTNVELYGWMLTQTLTLLKKTYDIAYSVAKGAEAAYKYEMKHISTSANSSYIGSSDYSSTRKGLLSGEALAYKISSLEKAFYDQSQRIYEINKVISMKTSFSDKFKEFTANGIVSNLTLPETLFSNDFSNLDYRRIQSVGVTVPAVTSAYKSISLILTMVTEGDLTSTSDQSSPSDTSASANPSIKKTILISTGLNDTGMFPSSVNDDRYLPFEGLALVNSVWEVKLGNTSNSSMLNSISDILLNIQYTAINAAPSQQSSQNNLSSFSFKNKTNPTLFSTNAASKPVNNLSLTSGLRTGYTSLQTSNSNIKASVSNHNTTEEKYMIPGKK